MSSYRVAIDKTTQTIDKRAKHFRNLIVAVTVVGLSSILCAVTAWSWIPLAGLFLLIPICGLYLFIDGRLLNQWRNDLFTRWEKCEIDFRAFFEAVIAISTLPKDSVKSMLETLPIDGDLVAEQGVSESSRQAIAAIVATIHKSRSDEIVLKAIGYTIAGIAIIISAVFWIWEPLFGLFAISLIVLPRKWVQTRRLRHARERIISAQLKPDFNLEKFIKIVSNIQWTPISAIEKKTVLATLSMLSS